MYYPSSTPLGKSRAHLVAYTSYPTIQIHTRSTPVTTIVFMVTMSTCSRAIVALTMALCSKARSMEGCNTAQHTRRHP